MNNVHTVNELLTAAAEALANRDVDALNRLRDNANGWMQTEDERQAQLAMLDAMEEAVDTIHALEA